MDEIITYVEEKKRVKMKSGKERKYAIGTRIITMYGENKEGLKAFYGIVVKDENAQKELFKFCKKLKKVKEIYTDEGKIYSGLSNFLFEQNRKNGMKLIDALEFSPNVIMKKGKQTNIIEGFNNACRNALSYIKRRTSGFAHHIKNLERDFKFFIYFKNLELQSRTYTLILG